MNTLPPDCHMHTPLCKHAQGLPAAYKAHAARMGIRKICFTDHAPAPDGYDAKHRMAPEQFEEYRQLVAAQQETAPPETAFGIEADYYPGCVDFLRDWLPKQNFDLVLGSVHYIEGWAFDDPEQRHVWDSVGIETIWRQYFQLLEHLAGTGIYDAAAHLDLPKKFGLRPADGAVREMAAPTLDRIKSAGMAIEINTSGLRRPVREIYPSPLLLEMACEREIPICFGSDAHAPDEVGHAFNEALLLAHNIGYRTAVCFKARRQIAYPLPAGSH